jgi:hypothetical protein
MKDLFDELEELNNEWKRGTGTLDEEFFDEDTRQELETEEDEQ